MDILINSSTEKATKLLIENVNEMALPLESHHSVNPPRAHSIK
jgi:hypothetical protein